MKTIKAHATLLVSAVAIFFFTLPGTALAHTISIGYENAGAGSVNVWVGTYDHGGHHLEGSLMLEGIGGTVYGPTVNPYTMLTATGVGFQPAGLIDGVTNFYPSTALGVDGPLTGDPSVWESFCPACGPVNHWQGVNFTGLTAGTYQFTYVPIASPSAEWDLWNNSLNGTFDLTGVVNPPSGVPEPGALTLMLSGLAAIAWVGRRRRRNLL